MNGRERLLTVLRGDTPDCVPVAPDFSNMIPARLTGKPFWDLYLYNDPPIWEAYIECAKRFDIDSLMDGYFSLEYPPPPGAPEPEPWETFIVERTAERIVTQRSILRGGQREWADWVAVYPVADPPTWRIAIEKMHLPRVPERPEPLEGVRPVDRGPEGLKRARRLMGDQGLVGVGLMGTVILHDESSIMDYYEHPEKYEALAEWRMNEVDRRFDYIMALEEKPDFLCVGGSGTLVTQTPDFFRHYCLPAVRRAIDLAADAGIPTQVHSCGPEKELVRIMAEETRLTVIDPLEQPPMGDCDLGQIKRLYGERLVLKGNLHTTRTMLHGSPDDVRTASRQAIDAAAQGGRFILSTGDQCGRDTPDENLYAMIETARTYGKY